jgi:hypothetical protein
MPKSIRVSFPTPAALDQKIQNLDQLLALVDAVLANAPPRLSSCGRGWLRRPAVPTSSLAALARLIWPTEGPTNSVLDRARRIDPTLGPRQADVLSEVEASGSVGTTTGAIARALGCAQPDTDITLGALSNEGLVEQDTSVHPHVYRLSPGLVGGAADGSQRDD